MPGVSLSDRPRLPSEHTLNEDETTESGERGSLLADKEANDLSHSTFLRRSPSIIFSTLFYIALALYAWVVTCILAHKPIGVKQYGVNIVNKDNSGWGWRGAKAYHALYVNSEKHFRTARLIQTIVSVLTIPLTSAVCVRAAVVFLQSGRASHVTMRQAITLADESWTDLAVIARLLLGGWKRYGSSLLLSAMFLHALGIAISPLQEVYLTTKTIRTPTYPQMMRNLVDIPDQFDSLRRSDTDYGYVTALTRSRLASTTNSQPQINLWSRAPDCNTLTQSKNSLLCLLNGNQYILGNMSLLNDPFFSQLPTGFSTGLIKQFAPRINSTAHRENITAADFPSNCNQIPDALWLRYANTSSSGAYALEVCMPGNMTATPWKSTRSRQDFREELYLNITFSGFEWLSFGRANGSYYTKITLDTTAGYFELPNYMNGGVNGPLINDNPSNYCDISCTIQGPWGSKGQDPIYDHNITRRAPLTGSPTDTAQQLSRTRNKGPLLIITLALFGMGSFIDKAQSYQSYFSAAKNNNATGFCLDAVPFMPLLHDWLNQENVGNSLDPCLPYRDNPSFMAVYVVYYLWAFLYNGNDGYAGERVQNAFTSAAFLANQAWMSSIIDGTLWVSYDLGAETRVPVISDKAILFLSVLLGVYLISLLALATYGALSPHWTSRLDSFAMIRIGASLADRFPLVVVKDISELKVLDETPGWIGDASGGMGNVGELGIGADAPLVTRRRYRCFEADHDHRTGR